MRSVFPGVMIRCWAGALLTIVMPAIYLYRRRKLHRAMREGHCPHCGYNLHANLSGTCPECGQPTAPAKM